MVYYPYRASYDRNYRKKWDRYRKNSYRSRGLRVIRNDRMDSIRNKLTFKGYIQATTLAAVNSITGYTINPLSDWVNDARYASFITTCNEWRLVGFKVRISNL